MFVALYAFLQSIIAKIVIALFGTTLVGIGAAVYACGQSGAASVASSPVPFIAIFIAITYAVFVLF